MSLLNSLMRNIRITERDFGRMESKMILHTIISPADIFYKEPEPQAVKKDVFSTDPYFYLDKCENYNRNIFKKKNKII